MSLDDIVAYYVNLLIWQYWDQPKAKATIDLYVRTLLANNVTLDVLNGYDIDTAVGKQLDIIGKYVGVTRYFTGQFFTGYFAFVKYDEIGGSISSAKRGFSDYTDPAKSGLWLKYEDIISSTFTLTDADYRVIIKMKIFQNNNNNSHKSIDDFIFNLFGSDVTVSQGGTMQINYTATDAVTALIQIAIEKQVLPKPIGVELVF